MTDNMLLKNALEYFDRGLAVVPIFDGTKATYIDGWQNKKLSRGDIEEYFTNGQDVTGVGIVTGELSNNLTILDFDGERWEDALENFLHSWDELNVTPAVKTGSSKRHLWVSCPNLPRDFTVKKFKRDGATIELRGNRMNNLAPPSLHPSGNYYSWLCEDANLVKVGFNELYAWLNEWGEVVKEKPKQLTLTAHDNGQRAPLPRRTQEFINSSEPLPEGERNDELYAASQQLAAAGYTQAEAVEILQPVGERVGLDAKEIKPTIKSGHKAARESGFTPIRFDSIPPLPLSAQLPAGLGEDASPWLDAYIDWSKKYSPRSYDGFHEACGLWVLSTVAARRVVMHFGKPRYTPLYIALCARTSLYAKSSAADNAEATLRESELDWLLAPDDSTPQKFINDMTKSLPKDFTTYTEATQDRIKRRLAFAGQRGWFYEEFGQHLRAISNERGVMGEFRGILRRFDDCKDRYGYATIGRGVDIVERPYLALLANMTPADVKPLAKRGNAMWNDGFWARFAFVTPPADERKRDKYPKSQRTVPDAIIKAIRDWHSRLEVPSVQIVDALDEDDTPTGKKRVEVEFRYPTSCTYGNGVYEAFYHYHDGLLDILESTNNTDLDGNYTRFAEKALRVSMLLASLENNNLIELRHWARAQQIAERWRVGLHAIYTQVNEPDISEREQQEEKVLKILQRHGKLTAARIADFIRGMSTADVAQVCEGLVSSGLLEPTETGRTIYYEIR